ncbi:PRR7 protein, partial [Amia calva]|nr:PRR7 protein [Amia calva]
MVMSQGTYTFLTCFAGFWLVWALIVMLCCFCSFVQRRLKRRREERLREQSLRALEMDPLAYRGYPPREPPQFSKAKEMVTKYTDLQQPRRQPQARHWHYPQGKYFFPNSLNLSCRTSALPFPMSLVPMWTMTTPNLQGTSTMLHCCLQTLICVPLSSPSAHKLQPNISIFDSSVQSTCYYFSAPQFLSLSFQPMAICLILSFLFLSEVDVFSKPPCYEEAVLMEDPPPPYSEVLADSRAGVYSKPSRKPKDPETSKSTPEPVFPERAYTSLIHLPMSEHWDSLGRLLSTVDLNRNNLPSQMQARAPLHPTLPHSRRSNTNFSRGMPLPDRTYPLPTAFPLFGRSTAV